MADQASLFNGADVVDIAFDPSALDAAGLTDVDALHRIAAALVHPGDTDTVFTAAEELKRLRVDLAVSENARRSLERTVKAFKRLAGEVEDMDLSDAGSLPS